MPDYTVDFPLIYKKKKYMPGDPVSMSEKLADPLLKKGTLLVSEEQESAPITEEAIVAAISQMEPMDATQWTASDGKPQLPALEALLQGKITAKERDAAWKRYQKETDDQGRSSVAGAKDGTGATK